MSAEFVRITEVFFSIQGESSFVGFPTVFIRLTGCPLRCHYCDSEYAFYGGDKVALDDLVSQAKSFNSQYVCVTGGEPLAQPNCLALLAALCDAGFTVSLETSGAMDIGQVDKRVHIVMDLKTPASGEVDKNRYENIPLLAKKDQIKFVLCDRQDYEWAAFKIDEYQLVERVGDIFLSPSYGQIKPEDIAQWILEDKLAVRLQTQLHKSLWGDKPGV